MVYEPDVPDSVNALYDLTCAEDGIEEEDVEAVLNNVVEQQLRDLYNNRERFAERLAKQRADEGGEGDEAA